LEELALDTPVLESYNSSAIFDLPDTIPDKPVVQVLTHGLGNDTLAIALKDATHFWQGSIKAIWPPRTSGYVD